MAKKPISPRISRRNALKTGAAAAGVVLAPQAARAQAPAAQTGGRRFRAFVRFGTGGSVQELRLLPIQPSEVVIRTEASAVCYTIVAGALATRSVMRASVPN